LLHERRVKVDVVFGQCGRAAVVEEAFDAEGPEAQAG
jgi:hypothetical protein